MGYIRSQRHPTRRSDSAQEITVVSEYFGRGILEYGATLLEGLSQGKERGMDLEMILGIIF